MKRKASLGVLIGLSIIASMAVISASMPDEKVRVIITVDKTFDESVIPAAGGKIAAKGKLFPIVVAELPAKAVEHMKKVKGVVRVEYDAEVHILRGKPPGVGKPEPSQPSQELPWGIERVGASAAWSTTDGSSNGVIEVAVLDTGIDYDHPDLAANLAWGVSVLHGKISEKPKDYKDKNGHGTHVAGTIAAVNNDIGVVGVAHGAEIYAIRVLGNDGSGWISDIILGIEQAMLGQDGVLDVGDPGIVGDPQDDAAEVISMSFGGGHVNALHDAIINASSHGIVLVAASGNEGVSTPSYPAAYPEVIAVGATDRNDQVPWWSNREVEVSAPGVGILSTYPDDTYTELDGTSMACPHVSGVVALIQAAYYNQHSNEDISVLSPEEVRNILHSAVDDLEDEGWDPDYGYGIVRADLAVQEAIS